MRLVLAGERPQVAADCFVAPDAALVGRVVLEASSSVWFGAVLRGDVEEIRVGARSNVQDGAILHTDPGEPLTVAEDVTVGHRAVLHGCTVGAGSLIGIGAIVLTGARIGAGCVIGAGALVPEGKVIPDGSVVMGVPGQVVRTLEAHQRSSLRDAAAHYVDNARRYRTINQESM